MSEVCEGVMLPGNSVARGAHFITWVLEILPLSILTRRSLHVQLECLVFWSNEGVFSIQMITYVMCWT